MSKTKKLTLSAMVTALCVISLAGSALLPRVTLSLAALAGLFPAVTVIVCGYGWALGTAAAAAILALLLLPDKTAGVWFAFFFGHYPIWKALIEGLQTRLGKPVLGYALKLLGFAVCLTALYFIFRNFFSSAIPYNFTENAIGPAVLICALVLAFGIYDLAFTRLVNWFRIKVLPKL